MTTGTVVAFIVTGAIMLVAIVGGIWLETLMPGPQQQRLGLPRQPRPATKLAAGQRINLSESVWDGPRTWAGTTGQRQ